ncbi:MAG: hypothetical protein WBZ37_23395 [Mycobacterium sp.]
MKTSESVVLVEGICGAARAENRSAAAQLAAIGELFGYLKCYCRTHNLLNAFTVDRPAGWIGSRADGRLTRHGWGHCPDIGIGARRKR